jgi:hypothetical protein
MSAAPVSVSSDAAPLASSATVDYSPDDASVGESEKHKEKRRLFGLLKKKDANKAKAGQALSPVATPTASPPAVAVNAPPASATTPSKPIPRSVSPGPQPHMTPPQGPTHLPTSPPPSQSISAAASPSRYVRSSSPRLHSPASSLIFERNVQEAPLPDDLQAAIPHHIQTEDYIPPILEASSHAITDSKLNPDEVEIVTHSAHQPAGTNIVHPEGTSGIGLGSGTLSPLSLGQGTDAPHLGSSAVLSESTTSVDEQASHYGSLDATDVRRLSFISFADVVQGEHVHEGAGGTSLLPRDLHMSILSTTTNRSPSPVRSPASSHGAGEPGLSPPTSGAPSVKGVDIAGVSKTQPSIGAFPPSSSSLAGTQSPSLVGSELTVETMRQALRKTGSGDLSAARSPVSPIERSSAFLGGSGSEAK